MFSCERGFPIVSQLGSSSHISTATDELAEYGVLRLRSPIPNDPSALPDLTPVDLSPTGHAEGKLQCNRTT
jgi:hypothetical protein